MVEKTLGSSATFEEKVNALVDQRLKDPTVLPAEYRAWLPRFIETQNIQLPMSQVQGLYLTGGTVNDLGGDVHGRIGMIRAGATPYEFIQVTFDANYDKWISDPTLFATHLSTQTSTASTTYIPMPNISTGMAEWLVMDTAGLKPQFKFFVFLGSSNAASTASATISFTSADAGGTVAAPYNSTEFVLTTTSTAGVLKLVNWLDMPASVTLDDYLFAWGSYKISNGIHQASITYSNIWIRWVSK